MSENQDRYTVREMAELFGVSCSAYYRWVKYGVSSRRREEDAELVELIRQVQQPFGADEPAAAALTLAAIVTRLDLFAAAFFGAALSGCANGTTTNRNRRTWPEVRTGTGEPGSKGEGGGKILCKSRNIKGFPGTA
ncbi:MAG: hypothetical protein LBC31_04005 [Treponema sp.]|jgi:hypothetical protein|nr:hypothetical protein [Treponema sp.]